MGSSSLSINDRRTAFLEEQAIAVLSADSSGGVQPIGRLGEEIFHEAGAVRGDSGQLGKRLMVDDRIGIRTLATNTFDRQAHP
jgi:hypothetical protein